jgi:hypothetical protein
MTDQQPRVLPQTERWSSIIAGATIDQSWRPNPYETPYIYVFGNQWNDSATEPTIEYCVPGAVDRKYVTDIIADLSPTKDNWTLSSNPDYKNFDYSWRPNPYAPPQIYQWENNGPVYRTTGATEVVLMENTVATTTTPRYYVETTLDDLIRQHPTEVFWALNAELKYDRFDFTWKPDTHNFRHVNVFGTELSKDVATYYINGPAYMLGYRDYNYIDSAAEIDTKLDMYYIDRGNRHQQFNELRERFPQLQKTRYLNSWVDTITRCVKRATTRLIWVLSSEVDYSDFDFDYYPSSWQRDMIHVFGTQWSHWGNTYVINTETFLQDTQYVRVIEHLPKINFVRKRKTKITYCEHDIIYIDHGNQTDTFEKLCDRFDNITLLTYDTSYLKTLSKWVERLSEYDIKPEQSVWVCSSVCDYSDFDFTWTPDPFQREQLSVFSSKSDTARQKFGDTFYINLSDFKREIQWTFDLTEYPKQVNYVQYLGARRLPSPQIKHDRDSQAEAIQEIKLQEPAPYYEYVVSSSQRDAQTVVPNLWDTSTSTIIVTNQDASRIFVPRTALNYVRGEVYDYPHISKLPNLDRVPLLDIVFFSNGEPNADENYECLLGLNLPNRIVRSDGVQGRIASQTAAALLSTTSWYFLVNAKLKVNPDFDFTWQPDRLQQSKHYIFTATNPVNDLEYGHQAIVANNRKLTLDTQPTGLDFTMSSPHEVVEINSGTAYYNTDPWTTWRTSFRECIKLRSNTDEASEYRLDAWLNVGNGENGQWSTAGAYDAVEYWRSVDGDLDRLMLSYDWRWLEEYYEQKYS